MRSRARALVLTLLALASLLTVALLALRRRPPSPNPGTKPPAASAAAASSARAARLPRGRRPGADLVELRGQVVAAGDGAPIRDAEIEIVSGEKAVASLDTNEAGEFVAFVPKGELSVRASALGFLPGGATATAPGAAVTLRLVRGATITGRVVRADDGTPVAGARVTAGPSAALGAIPSDGEGRFRLVGLPAGAYRPEARALGLLGQATEEVSVALGDARDGVVIAVRPAASLRIRLLVARTGMPCPNGEVMLTGSGGDLLRTAADESGEVLFPAILPGRYAPMPQCTRDGDGALALEELEIKQAPVEVTYRIPVQPLLRGVVLEEDGALTPRHDLRVVVRRVGAPDGGVLDESLVWDGRFSYDLYRSGQFLAGELQVQVVDWSGVVSVAPARVTTMEGAALPELRLVVAPRLELSGQVVDEQGTPLNRASVRAEQEGVGETIVDTSELDGNFGVSGLHPGKVQLTVLLGMFEQGRVPLPQVNGDFEPTLPTSSAVRLVVRAGRIDGEVISSEVGQRHTVMAHATDAPGSWFSPTGEDGHFLLHVPPTGTYALLVHGRLGESVDDVLAKPGDHVVLRLRPAARLRGTVRNAPRSFTVRASPQEKMFIDTGGKWELSGVYAGEVEVQAFTDDLEAERTIHLEPGATGTLDLTLAPRPKQAPDDDP